MADFRKMFYALAVVTLLAGFTVPASAQTAPLACQTSQSNVPIVRAEGYTELVGDIVLVCTGGQPTTIGQPVPQVNFTVFLNTNITSRVLDTTRTFNEALLIMDEPNTNLRSPAFPILNCGNTGALDSGLSSGPGVCSITSVGNPRLTYDGSVGTGIDVTTGQRGTCGATVVVNNVNTARVYQPSGGNGYGCGNPNVFQGRLGVPQNPNQFNAVSFLGVPFDAPGTNLIRTIRITNVRANATTLGVSSTFTTNQIQANIAVNGSTPVTINNPTQIVAYINRGLTFEIPSAGTVALNGGVRLRTRFDFVQCVSENPDLFAGTPAPNFIVPPYNTGRNAQSGNYVGALGGDVNLSPMVRFIEGFASSWKTRNISFHSGGFGSTGNATFADNAYTYNGGRNYPVELAQNVPGFVYNTEGGFQHDATYNTASTTPELQPTTNPPQGYGFQPVTATNQPLNSVKGNTIALDTGISEAGRPDSGTRLVANFTNIPSGAKVFVPPIIYLFRQGSPYVTSNPNQDPTSRTGGITTLISLAVTPAVVGNTGVMVLTTTDTAGAGAFSRRSGVSSVGTAAETQLYEATSGLAVYEILYTDPFSLEVADVPAVVAYQANVNQNLPTPNITTQVTGGFAPFYTIPAAGQPTPNAGSATPTHIPRFTPGTGPRDLFSINKCACNLLFPYVVSTAGFDSGIAIANSSADPGAQFGFSAIPQPGTVTFWYYGIMANGGAVPGPQTSKSVPAGQVLTYVASSGSTDWGLDGRAAGLIGYVITQAQFQYCHAFAYISALGAGPLTPGTSEGYLGIVLDAASLNRTNQVGENKAH